MLIIRVYRGVIISTSRGTAICRPAVTIRRPGIVSEPVEIIDIAPTRRSRFRPRRLPHTGSRLYAIVTTTVVSVEIDVEVITSLLRAREP